MTASGRVAVPIPHRLAAAGTGGGEVAGVDGVLVVDKPRGPTSHAAVARLRRALGTRKIGHAGTLDPMATGVLVVAIGEATKLVPWLTAHAKTYEATILLGVETDTLDAEGREIRREPLCEALLEALHSTARPDTPPSLLSEALERERRRTRQLPPVFSAIRRDGRRMYDRARRSEPVLLEERPVAVHRIELVAWRAHPPSLDVRLEAASGYYVRALARDLASSLGTAGHLTSLRRTRSGSFHAADALALDSPEAVLRSRTIPLDVAAARTLPVSRLTDAGAREASHGRPVAAAEIDPSTVAPDAPRAWFDAAGRFIAVGRIDEDGCGRVTRGFGRPLAVLDPRE